MIIFYVCDFCGKSFRLSRSQRYQMRKNFDKKTFCSPKCSSDERSKSCRGEHHHLYKNGKNIDKSGHVKILDYTHPKRNCINRIFEHRVVMEKHIGRYLRDDEIVHHINFNPSDNRIENLVIMSNSDHSRLHRNKRLEASV